METGSQMEISSETFSYIIPFIPLTQVGSEEWREAVYFGSLKEK